MCWKAVRLQQTIGCCKAICTGFEILSLTQYRCRDVLRRALEQKAHRLPAKVWVTVLADPLPRCSHGIGGCSPRGERVDGRVGIVVWVRLRD